MSASIWKPAYDAFLEKAMGGQYDESKHPRRPKGSPGGGKFAPKGGGDTASPSTDSALVSKDPFTNGKGGGTPAQWGTAQQWDKLASRGYERGLKTGHYETAKRILSHHRHALAAFERVGDEQMVNQYKARVKKLAARTNRLWDDIVNQKH